MRQWWRICVAGLLAWGVVAGLPAAAQGDSPPPGAVTVQATASDGLALVGDFYLVNPDRPTVLLLHQLYTDRRSWDVLVPALRAANFNVLAVDVRGHGATGGGLDWPQAVDDVQAWIDWLHAASGVSSSAVATIGSSMGSSLALDGCANSLDCRTAIAISPGWNYQGLSVQQAFAAGFGSRPVLLVYSVRDGWPRLGVPKMLRAATNPVTVKEYPRNVHGMDLFDTQGDTLIPLITDWLAANAG